MRYPFTDLSGAKVRPALIVGRVRGPDLILAFITSQVGGPAPPAACLLAPPDPEFGAMGLKGPSAVRLDKLATLQRGLIRRRLGAIGPRTEQRVNAALRRALDL